MPPSIKKPRRARFAAAPAREKVKALALALPEAECDDRGDHSTFRVRGKVFAYFLDNHHGDGIVSVCVKTELGENVDRARLEPERCYLPAYIGPRGWLGLKLDQGKVNWREIRELIERSFALSAPKSLRVRHR